MRTPRMMLSRAGPRKPGHSACLNARSGEAGAGSAMAVAVDSIFGVTGGASAFAAESSGTAEGTSDGAAGGGIGAGSLAVLARSRCSGVGVHRQWNSEPLPPTPAVRNSAHGTHASTIAATMDRRLTLSLR